jgi:hypothetical protein
MTLHTEICSSNMTCISTKKVVVPSLLMIVEIYIIVNTAYLLHFLSWHFFLCLSRGWFSHFVQLSVWYLFFLVTLVMWHWHHTGVYCLPDNRHLNPGHSEFRSCAPWCITHTHQSDTLFICTWNVVSIDIYNLVSFKKYSRFRKFQHEIS